MRARAWEHAVEAAKSRGFHDCTRGKPDTACPYTRPANVEDETGESAAWLIGWRGCKDTLDAARMEELQAEVGRLKVDLAKCQEINQGMADRVAKQSELLSRRAEKG